MTPRPDSASAMRSARGPTRRRATAAATDSRAYQANDPHPIAATSVTAAGARSRPTGFLSRPAAQPK